jgi:hypothetical protein
MSVSPSLTRRNAACHDRVPFCCGRGSSRYCGNTYGVGPEIESTASAD